MVQELSEHQSVIGLGVVSTPEDKAKQAKNNKARIAQDSKERVDLQSKAVKLAREIRDKVYNAEAFGDKRNSIYSGLYEQFSGKSEPILDIWFQANLWPSQTLTSGKVKRMGINKAIAEHADSKKYGKLINHANCLTSAFSHIRKTAEKSVALAEAEKLEKSAKNGSKSAKKTLADNLIEKQGKQLKSVLGSIASLADSMKAGVQKEFYNGNTEAVEKAIAFLTGMSGKADPVITENVNSKIDKEIAEVEAKQEKRKNAGTTITRPAK